MKLGLNLVGPQVRRLRVRRKWTQPVLAEKLQLQGWNFSVGPLGKMEAQLRCVPDCELLFLAEVLGSSIQELFPKSVSLRQLSPRFQSGERLAVLPTRNETCAWKPAAEGSSASKKTLPSESV